MSRKNKNDIANDKAVSLFRKRKLLVALLSVFLLLCVVIGLVTIYGLNTGGFTISVNDELSGLGIALFDDEADTGLGKQRLNGSLLSKAVPICQPEINEELVRNKDGSFKSRAGDYIGYTFYLRNVGEKTCNIDHSFKITKVSRNVENAIRFWVFYGDEADGTIYKKADENEEAYVDTVFGSYKETSNFEGKDLICTRTFMDVAPGDQIKISVIMWLEGEDPDCVDFGKKSIAEGSIKVGMGFSAWDEKII